MPACTELSPRRPRGRGLRSKRGRLRIDDNNMGTGTGPPPAALAGTAEHSAWAPAQGAGLSCAAGVTTRTPRRVFAPPGTNDGDDLANDLRPTESRSARGAVALGAGPMRHVSPPPGRPGPACGRWAARGHHPACCPSTSAALVRWSRVSRGRLSARPVHWRAARQTAPSSPGAARPVQLQARGASGPRSAVGAFGSRSAVAAPGFSVHRPAGGRLANTVRTWRHTQPGGAWKGARGW